MSTLTRTTLEVLGRRVAEQGIDATSTESLATLAEVAQNVGVSPVVCTVLINPAEPEVARLRAFEMVTCAVSGAVRRNHALAA